MVHRNLCGGFVETTNPGAVFTSEPSRGLMAAPVVEEEHGERESKSSKKNMVVVKKYLSSVRVAQTKSLTKICTKFHLKSILILQDLRQSQSPETVPTCIVVQCFPHDKFTCVMNVISQRSQAFSTSSGPLSDSTSKYVHGQ